MTIDAERAYRVWRSLIADEELYEAMMEGRHAALAESRGLDAGAIAVLDELRALPGTRWNIENLRFRAARETGAALVSYMPRTVQLLTRGDPDWLKDIVFEYLSRERWRELGHYRLAECARFAEHIRTRIAQRRRLPEHLDAVLHFEMAIIDLMKKTRGLTGDAWPAPPPSDVDLGSLRPRWGPAVALIDLPTDITEWIRSGDTSRGEPGPDPVSMLAFIPSLTETHRLRKLGDGARLAFEMFIGERTLASIADTLEAEMGLDREALFAFVHRLLEDRALLS